MSLYLRQGEGVYEGVHRRMRADVVGFHHVVKAAEVVNVVHGVRGEDDFVRLGRIELEVLYPVDVRHEPYEVVFDVFVPMGGHESYRIGITDDGFRLPAVVVSRPVHE